MNLHTLQVASKLHEDLRRAQEQLEALTPYRVVGIVIDRGEGGLNPIRIERGGNTGNGSITSIGFSGDMESVLTEALMNVFNKRVYDAGKELRELGVDVGDAA